MHGNLCHAQTLDRISCLRRWLPIHRTVRSKCRRHQRLLRHPAADLGICGSYMILGGLILHPVNTFLYSDTIHRSPTFRLNSKGAFYLFFWRGEGAWSEGALPFGAHTFWFLLLPTDSYVVSQDFLFVILLALEYYPQPTRRTRRKKTIYINDNNNLVQQHLRLDHLSK